MSVEESPEFKKALNEACEAQYNGWLYGGSDVANSKDKMGDITEEARRHAERLRREAELMSNPHAREIMENLRRLHGQGGGLICPSCGDVDHHNRMNGRAWCMKCNLPLMSQEKAENWAKPVKPKIRSYTFNEPDEVARVRRA